MRRILTSLGLVAVLGAPNAAARSALDGEWLLLHFQDQAAGVYDLYLVRPDGTGLVNLTNGAADDYEGSPSPDGSMIAVSSDDGTSTEIWVMDPDGTGRRRLTSGGGWSVAWAPDGTIVYSQGTGIHVVAADGTGHRLVVDGLAGIARNLDVSPDGTMVVFDVQVEADRDIYSVPMVGGAVVELTTEGGFEPVWSPDGTEIAFVTFRGEYGDNVWVMDPDGSNQRNLIPSRTNDFEPSWSPDGGRIVFEAVRDEDFAIVIYDLDGGTATDVITTPTAAAFRSPVWVAPVSAVAPTTTVVGSPPDGADEKKGSLDPIWMVLVASLVATAGIGLALARKRTEPPPPPAA